MPNAPTLTKQVLAEFLGTFALVFAAVGSAVSCGAPVSSGLGIVGSALANGLVLTVIVTSFGPISGAHFNPAVTLALWLIGRARAAQIAPYLIAQLLAATLAALLCKTMYPPEAIEATRLALCQPAGWLSSPHLVVLLAEAVMTCLLMIAIYGTVIDQRSPKSAVTGGLGLGGIVAANILAAGAVSGAAMNPARAFGPAVVQYEFGFHWCYWLAPCVGAIVGALIYERLLLDESNKE